MTAVTKAFSWSQNSDAEFRNWIQGVQGGLFDVGMVQTTDTGQIDLVTATRPTAGSSAGYNIYRFSDTLQATKPFFVKIEYGSSNNSSGVPSVFLTYGTATDGAGVLTGNKVTTRFTMSAGSTAASAGTKNNYFFHNGSSFGMVLAADYNLGVGFHMLAFAGAERTLNNDGTPNDGGVYCINSGPGAGNQVSVIPYGAFPMPASLTVGQCLFPYGTTFGTASDGADVSFFPHITATPRAHSAHRLVLGHFQNDVSKFTTIVVPHYGVPATYLALGIAVNSMGLGGTSSLGPASMLMRFE